MKKLLLSAITAASLGAVALTANAATVSSGTINFSGTIATSTCSVAVNGNTTGTVSVTLPTVVDVMLGQAGSGGWTAVTL